MQYPLDLRMPVLAAVASLLLAMNAWAQPEGTPEPAAAEETTPVATETSAAETVTAAPASAPEPAPTKEASAPAPAPAATQEGGDANREVGWDTQYGLLFALNNVFTQPGIVSGYRGLGVGGQLHLSPTMAVRAAVDVTRTTNPPTITKTITATGSDRVVSYDVSANSPTAYHAIQAGGDFLLRLGTSSIAPYVGGGLFLSWAQSDTHYEDDLSIDGQVTAVDNVNSALGLAVDGVLGISWRVHERFSIFAEYNLGMTLFSWTSNDAKTTVVDRRSGGTPTTTTTRVQSEETRAMNLAMGLAQGASLGLIAFF